MGQNAFRIILYTAFLSGCFCGTWWPETWNTFQLSIIHFSDFHARFMPVSPTGGICYDYAKDNCVGGIARVASVVRQLKEKRRNSIFLNAGDCFQGTLYYDLHRGNITAYFMNRLPHDAITLGNHDFDDQVSGMVSFVNQLSAPVVVTNIDNSEMPSWQNNLYTNSTIIKKNGRKIGIIGVIYSGTDRISSTTGKLKFLDEVETINSEATRLKANGVKIILVLSHCGIDRDKVIAKSCPDVDVVVGGHSHTLLYNGKPPSGEKAYGKYPIVMKQNNTGRTVLVVHASAFTKYMGDIRVTFDYNGEVKSWKGNPIYLDQAIKEDRATIEELKPWTEDVNKVGKKVIGESLIFLNASCSSGECSLGDLLTDALLDNFPNASISLISSGSMDTSIPKGPIYYEDLYALFAFNDTLDIIELQGKYLLQALEENVAGATSKAALNNPRLLQWSGLKVVYNLTNEVNKVISAKVRCAECPNLEYKDLDTEKWYNIIVKAYFLSSSPRSLKKYRQYTIGETHDLDSVVKYIEKIKVISFRDEARMVFV